MDERGRSTRIPRFISAGRNRFLLAIAALGLVGSVLTLVAVQGTSTTSAPTVGLAAEAAAAKQAAPAVPALAAPAAVGASDAGMSGMPDMGSSGTASTPAPSASASPSSTSGSAPSGGSGDCTSKEMLTQLYQHLESAHLAESPGQQAADALSLDQWIKTHTVWLNNMIVQPASGGPTTLAAVLDPFVQHMQAAHLDASLGQQVADALNLDQWIKVHTVLVGNMLKPLFAQTTC